MGCWAQAHHKPAASGYQSSPLVSHLPSRECQGECSASSPLPQGEGQGEGPTSSPLPQGEGQGEGIIHSTSTLPLTPSLSPWERAFQSLTPPTTFQQNTTYNHSQPFLDRSNNLGRTTLPSHLPSRECQGECSASSPLPSGEGQGEGSILSPLPSGEGQGEGSILSPLPQGEGQGEGHNLFQGKALKTNHHTPQAPSFSMHGLA